MRHVAANSGTATYSKYIIAVTAYFSGGSRMFNTKPASTHTIPKFICRPNCQSLTEQLEGTLHTSSYKG